MVRKLKARPHQVAAIEAVVDGFQDNDRGRLIMACGTGKTLTAMWAAEKLQSSRTLVLVPSLGPSLILMAVWRSVQGICLVNASTQQVDTRRLKRLGLHVLA